MSRQKEYYMFRRPHALVSPEHRFTDDVALCKAFSKSQAIKIFGKMYSDIKDDEVCLVKGCFNAWGIVVCTDY